MRGVVQVNYVFGRLHIYLGEILQEADSKNTEVTSKQTKRLTTTSMLLEGGYTLFLHFLRFIDCAQILKTAEIWQREILKMP